MISVEEAWQRIAASLSPIGVETVPLTACVGRILAESLRARVTQPPLAVSAMDGYAVRAADIVTVPARLRVTGIIAAGQISTSALAAGEAMRIFTGAALPEGADTILIQENAEAQGDVVIAKVSAPAGKHIRKAGLDFAKGDIVLEKGRSLSPRDIGLAAAANHAWLTVYRSPRVAILATGDEIALPGDRLRPGQIVGSNSFALAAMVHQAGGIPVILPTAHDSPEALATALRQAEGTDMLVTSGGASVGDHDLVRSTLTDLGMALDFWQIAMRPGKPLMFGRWNDRPVLGLPGNPVSALVCATLFLVPALRRLQGEEDAGLPVTQPARLGAPLPANDHRQDYLRASLHYDSDGHLVATPLLVQDSAMLSALARADALIVRPPHAPAIATDTDVPIIAL